MFPKKRTPTPLFPPSFGEFWPDFGAAESIIAECSSNLLQCRVGRPSGIHYWVQQWTFNTRRQPCL